ncbi:MAG: sigma-70 family RNA polymerase sigma factor [Alphaproteobacteria bacterium]|nr:sigma-70 family RNA polymerase sigma factor [Alphaproteobacteria bacterium]MCB1682066.1 sigma-70 family RNA polymerase sigma factor [Alphaproteobacteria bacterium]MCB9975724.1 sigma-70 family RNA polymerase sigma factor [Rhodospirillales bacterium]
MAGEPDDINLSDESLMARISDGDHEAFAQLVNRHSRMFYAAAFRMCGQQEEAEDIVQEAFVKLWKKPQSWNPDAGAKFTTWFYRVVTNQARDHLRKRKPQTEIPDTLGDGQPGALEALEERRLQESLEGAIQNLPERQKEALNLCFYEGFSNKEAAEILGVGVKALESLLMRAKAALRDELGRQGYDVQHKKYG